MMMSIITLAAPPVTSSATVPTFPVHAVKETFHAIRGQWYQELLTDANLLGGDENTCPGLLIHHLLVKRLSAILNVQLEHEH